MTEFPSGTKRHGGAPSHLRCAPVAATLGMACHAPTLAILPELTHRFIRPAWDCRGGVRMSLLGDYPFSDVNRCFCVLVGT